MTVRKMRAMNPNAAMQALVFSIAISFLNGTQDIQVLDLIPGYSQPDPGVEFLLVI